MFKSKYSITKEMLEEMHYENRLAPVDIAREIGCSVNLVRHYFKVFGIKKLPKFERLLNMKFERLTVKKFLGIRDDRAAWWLCECECGNLVEGRTAALKNGSLKSCGCFGRDRSTSHAMSYSRPYHIWQSMKTRCSNLGNPNYARYGAKGITYDPKWETFEGFWEDMSFGYADNLTIERKDCSGPYNKSNCIWATYDVQSNNRPCCISLTWRGETKTASQWANDLGVARSKIYYLKKRGLSDDQIFEEILS